MAEKLISIPENDQLQALCGNFDENLKLLEQRYQVSVVCRGEDIRIHGTQAQVDLAAGAITALLAFIGRGQALTPQTIHYVTEMVENGASGQLSELADTDTVCLTAAGKAVYTRTEEIHSVDPQEHHRLWDRPGRNRKNLSGCCNGSPRLPPA